MLLGGLITLAVLFLSDPDSAIVTNLPFGGSTIVGLISLMKICLYVGMLHLARKALFDYLDLEVVINKAKESSQGAGLLMIGMGLMYLSIAIVSIAAVMN